MKVIATATLNSIRQLSPNFGVSFVASFVLIVIAFAADEVIKLFRSECSDLSYPTDHIFALVDVKVLTAFTAVLMISLAGRLLVDCKLTDDAFMVAKKMLIDAFSGFMGVFFAVGFALGIRGDWRVFYGSIVLAAVGLLLMTVGNAVLAATGSPLTRRHKAVVAVFVVVAAVAFPAIATRFYVPEPPTRPKKSCESVVDRPVEGASSR